jgi:hypothetical protein
MGEARRWWLFFVVWGADQGQTSRHLWAILSEALAVASGNEGRNKKVVIVTVVFPAEAFSEPY